MCRIFACLSSPDHQEDETLNSTAAGANETKQGDNVSVTVDANNNELGQPSADQPETSGLASASSPALHGIDIPAYTSTDPGTWGEINDKVQEYWVERGPQFCQNMTADFSGSEQQYKNQKRRFSKSLFNRRLVNGENVQRDWLLYSPSKGAVYCFVCRLFGGNDNNAHSKFGGTDGFNDWKHANDRIVEHEGSESHHKCMLVWITRTAGEGKIDNELKRQYETESQYWSEVLKRVVAVIKFISERGLGFRGDNRQFGSPQNGNYLGCLELISQFDPFLREHIVRFGNAGKGTPSYLSSTVCEELIDLMGDKMLSVILDKIRMAKYFSLIVDSSPDISHSDQLTFVVRYVSEEGITEERFLKFLPIRSHTGESLFNSVISVLTEMNINIENCRGQCFDNASNMSGVYKGVQSRICEVNPLAEWVPCAAHTLNLVGVNAVNCCLETDEFFTFVQSLFNFCSKSTWRWQIVTSNLEENEKGRIQTLKSLSNTRWSAHAQATSTLCLNYDNIFQSLQTIADDYHQNLTTRNEATSLSRQMEKLEIAILCCVWNTVLQRVQKTSTQLQMVALDLSNAVALVGSLRDFIADLRDQFERFESTAKNMSSCVSQTYKTDIQRERRRKKQPDDSSVTDSQSTMSGRQKFQVCVFNVIIDKLVAELDRRYKSYKDLEQSFGFLSNMHTITSEELRSNALCLQKKYHTDLQDDFPEEIAQFKDFTKNEKNKCVVALLQLLRRKNLQSVFPNVDIALRIFLTLPVTNASGERSFSKLSLVKNCLRSSMLQERLNHLTLMSLESDILRSLDFSDIIKDFSFRKSRKKSF